MMGILSGVISLNSAFWMIFILLMLKEDNSLMYNPAFFVFPFLLGLLGIYLIWFKKSKHVNGSG
jgi:hypothetical protein